MKKGRYVRPSSACVIYALLACDSPPQKATVGRILFRQTAKMCAAFSLGICTFHPRNTLRCVYTEDTFYIMRLYLLYMVIVAFLLIPVKRNQKKK